MNNQTQGTITPESIIKEVHKLAYVQCTKSGMHFGQVCNMICVEPSCLEDLICCCACIEQSHKKHQYKCPYARTKPLKMILNESKHQAEKSKPTNFNIDVILDIMNQSQKQTLDIFQNCKKEIMGNLDEIEKSLIGYYSSVSEQIRLKNSDPKLEVAKAFEVITAAKTTEEIKSQVKKLVAMIPTSKGEETDGNMSEITEGDLIETLKTTNEEVNQMISKNILDVNVKLKEYQKALETEVNNTNIWKKSNRYKFSSTFKHPDVKVVSDFIVKSVNTSGYKFSIMEPGLENGAAVKKMAFKIKQCSSNWVAVGMCHKNIVSGKGYTFNFSSLGHGGYMISANGGTWSNTSNQYNNKVKAFKFIKGDTVELTVDQNLKKMVFKKKQESFEIPFTKIDGDALHPCVLFYYMNDEVEFLPNYKP